MKKDCINSISNFISHKVTKDIYIPVKTLKENAFPEGGRGRFIFLLNGLFLKIRIRIQIRLFLKMFKYNPFFEKG